MTHKVFIDIRVWYSIRKASPEKIGSGPPLEEIKQEKYNINIKMTIIY